MSAFSYREIPPPYAGEAPASQTLNYLWAHQWRDRCIGEEALSRLARHLKVSEAALRGVRSFYHFFHERGAGDYTIYLNDSILAEFSGYAAVKEAFEEHTGARMGHTDPRGRFGLYATSCIGLSDQEPAALVNFHPITRLTPGKVAALIARLKAGESLEALAPRPATPTYCLPSQAPGFLFRPWQPGAALSQIRTLTPRGVIEQIGRAGLRGLGGAFFPTATKWLACQQEAATPKYIVCNADEGEPGTFKDRVLLEQYAGLMIEGMALAGYAVGARMGIIYLRAEYQYLLPDLYAAIDQAHEEGLLGKNIAGQAGVDFDLYVQLGAGAYVCGEESALLESMEGRRGEPRTKQFFPTQKGFLGRPTVVNNVETFCAAARILEGGAEAFLAHGRAGSPGTKLLSVAGDCARPGVYEIHWGLSLGELLDAAGADAAAYVQLSGAAGPCIDARHRDRAFALDDLRCGGSLMIFNNQRDLMAILRNFAAFFVRESCGICTPCRAGNIMVLRQLEKLRTGTWSLGDPKETFRDWGRIMRQGSRCGLGKTATTALESAMAAFPAPFDLDGNQAFDLEAATREYEHFLQSYRHE